MGETELANQYLNTFSAIMRETLRNADKLMISLREEINLLEKYVKIEKLRFDFNYTLTISNELALDEIEVPPMLIQPLLENAIKHGMTSMNKRDQISFEITKNNNDLKCTITNPNFPISGNKTTAGGYGISFTKQRLNHFNKLHPENPIELQQFKTDQIFVSQLQFHNWFS
jgi:LytS/YehU family sensor histidine kinase